jgi:hypothetical protein
MVMGVCICLFVYLRYPYVQLRIYLYVPSIFLNFRDDAIGIICFYLYVVICGCGHVKISAQIFS